MSDAVLAGPPGDCCFTGIKHEGEAVGQVVSLGGMETYVSAPKKESKKIILYLADVYSPLYINSKLLQDYFAVNGYLVLGPDYFFGDAIHYHTEADFDRMAWITAALDKATKSFPNWLKVVKEKYGTDSQYFAVGYCFGAPFVCDLVSSDEVSAGAFAHPALLNESHFKDIKQPLLLSCAEIDHTFPAEFRRRAEDILIEQKATFHLQLFSGVSHGFGTRGDPKVENSRWAKEESARSVIGWFDRFSRK